jgi:hypothetical protein
MLHVLTVPSERQLPVRVFAEDLVGKEKKQFAVVAEGWRRRALAQVAGVAHWPYGALFTYAKVAAPQAQVYWCVQLAFGRWVDRAEGTVG